jgi:hypothetical protein
MENVISSLLPLVFNWGLLPQPFAKASIFASDVSSPFQSTALVLAADQTPLQAPPSQLDPQNFLSFGIQYQAFT